MSFLENSGNVDIETIMAMHRYMRPKGSRTEQAFINQYIKPLGAKDDKWGNYHLTVGDNPHGVLWSSHTDTVHINEGMQQVVVDEKGWLRLNKRSKSNCLGADDGAGVWLMTEMIKARIPGLYIFHYGEEKGCEGSEAIAKHAPEVLKGIKFAIAFDRRDANDIITHITSQRICSQNFADSLMKQLPEGYKTCDRGMRTDIKLYDKLVDECVNISVGYTAPHSSSEALDLYHLIKLRNHLVKIDASKLVASRNKSITEYASSTPSYRAGTTSYTYDIVPRTVHDIVKSGHVTIADMMVRAGVKFDDLLHLVLEEQKLNPRTRTYNDPEIKAPSGWKNPHVVETTATLTTVTTESSKPAVVTETKTEEASKKDVAPHHINNPGASDTVASVSRGGGSPNQVPPMRTGNPAHDAYRKHHALGSE